MSSNDSKNLQPIFQVALDRWRSGHRDRELGLELLFLAWMHWADPPFLTGLTDDPSAQALWHEIYDHFNGVESGDPEFLYVAAHMAQVTPWALGSEAEWTQRAKELARRASALSTSYDKRLFLGRGAYGEYFASIQKGRAGVA